MQRTALLARIALLQRIALLHRLAILLVLIAATAACDQSKPPSVSAGANSQP